MNKQDLIDTVSEVTGSSKADAGRALEALLGAIENALKRDEQVTIVGFGTFKAKHRKARTGRKPGTSETINIAASTGVSFKAGKGLKDALNQK